MDLEFEGGRHQRRISKFSDTPDPKEITKLIVIEPLPHIRWDKRYKKVYESDGGAGYSQSYNVLQQKWKDIDTGEERWVDVPEDTFTEKENKKIEENGDV